MASGWSPLGLKSVTILNFMCFFQWGKKIS